MVTRATSISDGLKSTDKTDIKQLMDVWKYTKKIAFIKTLILFALQTAAKTKLYFLADILNEKRN